MIGLLDPLDAYSVNLESAVRGGRRYRAFAAVHAHSPRCDAASLKRTFEQVRSILTQPRSAFGSHGSINGFCWEAFDARFEHNAWES